jgi:hypothetical protein
MEAGPTRRCRHTSCPCSKHLHRPCSRADPFALDQNVLPWIKTASEHRCRPCHEESLSLKPPIARAMLQATAPQATAPWIKAAASEHRRCPCSEDSEPLKPPIARGLSPGPLPCMTRDAEFSTSTGAQRRQNGNGGSKTEMEAAEGTGNSKTEMEGGTVPNCYRVGYHVVYQHCSS